MIKMSLTWTFCSMFTFLENPHVKSSTPRNVKWTEDQTKKLREIIAPENNRNVSAATILRSYPQDFGSISTSTFKRHLDEIKRELDYPTPKRKSK
jgi:hypothetical protein